MAKAIFTKEFNYSSRTKNAGWAAKPSPVPQEFPQEFIDAAVAAGHAEKEQPAAGKRSRVKSEKG